jgi:hypothetical protein
MHVKTISEPFLIQKLNFEIQMLNGCGLIDFKPTD